jgi:membrane protein YfhO
LPNHRVNLMVRPELVGRPPETAFRLRADGATRVHVVENELPAREPGEPNPPRRLDLDPAAALSPPEALALGANISLCGRSASRWGLAGSFTLESLVAPTREQLVLSQRFFSIANLPAAVALLQAGAVTHVVARLVVPEGLRLLGTVPSPLLAPVRIFRTPDPLPGSYVVARAVRGSDEEALRFLLDPRADRAGTVVLSDGPAAAGVSGFVGTSRVTERRPDALRVDVEASSDALLVLVEAYDPGWTATVDGRPAQVYRANLGFRAVPVPAGRHSVRLLYRPRTVMLGLAVSAATLTGVVAVVGQALAKRIALSRLRPSGS